ncbi:MAG: hypothetical protein ACI35O_01695 [Bacillaceae bacterium]
MKFTKKTLRIVAFSAALVIPAMGFAVPSQLDKVSASDDHLTDEEIFADAYKGLTKSEVSTYVGYLDEKEKLNTRIDDLLSKEGKVTDKNSAKYNELISEVEQLDNNLYLLEKKSWIVLEKERINGFTNIDEDMRQSLLNNLTVIFELETKATNFELTPAEKDKLDSEYRAYNGDIFFFNKSEEIEQLDGLTKEEKSELLKSYLKINELNGKVANLTYDEYYQIVLEDQETYKKLDAEITAIYEEEIAPLEKKAGVETSFESLQW